MQSLGIYVHVPFCRSKCGYCDFCSVAGADLKLKDKYVKAVIEHMRESASLSKSYTVDTVYFGGGTPTSIGEKLLIKLLSAIRKSFSVSKSAEITVEANPESAGLKTLKRLRKAGFNRISIGVQSSNDAELKALGRIHTYADAETAVKNARAAGFDNLSLDLMYGLPGQTQEVFLASAAKIMALSPEHISCYALKLEPGTPMCLAAPPLPSDDAVADMYLDVTKHLESAGYEHYEISNYAKPSRRSRHNQKYWDLSEYLGFGPSSHSFFGGRRFSYTKDIEAYVNGFLSDGTVLDED
ncbi:MAG: radical SAM family heme chaperone HemW, partial [Bacillota bacterium]|nr:radical SAM family heme chaperone HemW [Bacillota bacterium]